MTQIDEPNIDDKIREMLFSWHKWRDYYYSDLKEQVITDDEWKVTRDKIDDDAIKAIKALIATQIQEARINEMERFANAKINHQGEPALFNPDGLPISTPITEEMTRLVNQAAKDRIAQLRSTQ